MSLRLAYSQRWFIFHILSMEVKVPLSQSIPYRKYLPHKREELLLINLAVMNLFYLLLAEHWYIDFLNFWFWFKFLKNNEVEVEVEVE